MTQKFQHLYKRANIGSRLSQKLFLVILSRPKLVIPKNSLPDLLKPMKSKLKKIPNP
jgi:hypothetical protein